MEEETTTYNRSREQLTTTIPKNIGFMVERPPSSSSYSSNKSPTDPSQRPPSPILERFRACLREREEETGVEGANPEEIVRLYREALTELTFNSKPIITDLTIIAGEHLDCGKGIAAAICSRILEVPVEQKLPSLYLLDSIVKNIRHDYVRYFAARLPEVFCEAYKHIVPSLYPAMRHLFRTWADVFPPSVLRTIEAELQFSPRTNFSSSSLTSSRTSESQSPRRTHSIHVNPKYLVARRQFEHSDAIHKTDPHYNARMTDFEGERMERELSESPKGWSGARSKFHNVDHVRRDASGMQIGQQHSSTVYSDYDFDHGEMLASQIGVGRIGSTGVPVGGSSSSLIGTEKLLSPSRIKLFRPCSPSAIGHGRSLSPPVGSLARDISPRSIAEMPSPSQTEFGITRAASTVRERNDWWERRFSDDGAQQMEASRTVSLYNQNNGFDQRRLPQTRALIDAYGNYRGKPTFYGGEVSKVERIEENGINKEASRKWQNSEEEEYVWEDMSPTLSDRSRSNDLMPLDSSAGSLIGKSGLGKSGFSETEFTRGTWLGRSLQMADNHAVIAEDRNSTLSMGHGSVSRKTQRSSSTQDEVLYHSWGSRGSQEHGKLPHHFPPSSQPYPNPIPRTRAFPSSYIEQPFHKSNSNQSNVGSLYSNPLNLDGLSSVTPVSTSMFSVEKHLAQWSQPKYNPLPSLPIVSHQKEITTQFDSVNVKKSLVNQGPNQSLVIPLQQLDAVGKKTLNSTKPLPLQQAGLLSLNHPSRERAACLLPQLLQPLEAQDTLALPAPEQIPSHLQVNSLSGVSPSPVTVNNMPTNICSHMIRKIPPPLPPGPPPLSSQLGHTSQNMGPILSQPPPGTDFSSILSTLMAQGVITLQGSIGVEFDQELLKVRHESAINALYADLPRQCTTCGLRFKCQEEHSNHMDWHVTKNRMSRNRKQKPSRKWFVSAKEWLSGTEALGTEAVPGFLPAEVASDRKDDQEMAVPADENQNVCALCGEPFEDFYSDEAEEWMYKGSVYLNAPEGSLEGIDRSQLGPIVHAKCRSESTTDSHVDFQRDEMGDINDLGNQRKRMRI